jgi:hypothetical protein
MPPLPRLLVVDAQFDVAMGIALPLRGQARVDFEREPAHVLVRLADGERWDLIVCDAALDGPELLARIEREAPAIAPVLVFASDGLASELAERVLITGRPCFAKPVRGETLLALALRSYS